MTFELDGQEFIGLNGGPMYNFSPAISFFVRCETQAEIDEYWSRILEGGTPHRRGWLTDKFGVTWQVVPTALADMLRDNDRQKADRVMSAMMKMTRLDLNLLR